MPDLTVTHQLFILQLYNIMRVFICQPEKLSTAAFKAMTASQKVTLTYCRPIKHKSIADVFRNQTTCNNCFIADFLCRNF